MRVEAEHLTVGDWRHEARLNTHTTAVATAHISVHDDNTAAGGLLHQKNESGKKKETKELSGFPSQSSWSRQSTLPASIPVSDRQLVRADPT